MTGATLSNINRVNAIIYRTCYNSRLPLAIWLLVDPISNTELGRIMKRAFFCTLVLVAFAATTSIASAQDGWGNLTGQIIVTGDVPENLPEAVKDNPDRNVCLVDGKIPLDDGVVVNDKNQLGNVYVMMYTGRGAELPKKFHPSYDAKNKVKLTLDNLKCRFVPKASFVRPGQTLILKNSDNVGHNCRIATMGHEHNVNIVKNSSVEVKLGPDSDSIPGEVKCDIHTWMDAVILIRDNPYVAITDAAGKFKLENVPAGDWKFQFWHKNAGYLKTIEIKGYKPDRRGTIEATIKDGETLELGTLEVPGEAIKPR